jgi:hypothetical protein
MTMTLELRFKIPSAAITTALLLPDWAKKASL